MYYFLYIYCTFISVKHQFTAWWLLFGNSDLRIYVLGTLGFPAYVWTLWGMYVYDYYFSTVNNSPLTLRAIWNLCLHGWSFLLLAFSLTFYYSCGPFQSSREYTGVRFLSLCFSISELVIGMYYTLHLISKSFSLNCSYWMALRFRSP